MYIYVYIYINAYIYVEISMSIHLYNLYTNIIYIASGWRKTLEGLSAVSVQAEHVYIYLYQ